MLININRLISLLLGLAGHDALSYIAKHDRLDMISGFGVSV